MPFSLYPLSLNDLVHFTLDDVNTLLLSPTIYSISINGTIGLSGSNNSVLVHNVTNPPRYYILILEDHEVTKVIFDNINIIKRI